MLIAHEIYHKPGKFYKFIGIAVTFKNLYIHFPWEHLYGHHRKVATPEDAASAAKRTTLYEFVPKSFINTYKSVFWM